MRPTFYIDDRILLHSIPHCTYGRTIVSRGRLHGCFDCIPSYQVDHPHKSRISCRGKVKLDWDCEAVKSLQTSRSFWTGQRHSAEFLWATAKAAVA
jgi:hypothetical protein